MLVRLCVILQWSGAPAVRCPGSAETQRDSTEGIASLLSHVAPVTQTASRDSRRCLTSLYLNDNHPNGISLWSCVHMHREFFKYFLTVLFYRT